MSQAGIIWSDLDSGLRIDPQGRVALLVNANAVKNSILNILGTRLGEVPMLRSFGSPVHALLGEPMLRSLARFYGEQIQQIIEQWDDRVLILTLEYRQFPDENQIELSGEFRIKGYSEVFNFAFVL